jgi:transporter family protein
LGRKRSVEVGPQSAGRVSTVSLIDNGSMVIALLLGWLFLQEALTPAKLTGSGFIVVGLLVIARG